MAAMVSSPLASSSSSTASSSGRDSIATRLRELLNDVERQIQSHISEQRARGPLRLDEEDANGGGASGVSRTHQAALSSLTSAVHSACPFSKRRSWRRRSTPEDHLLRDIFDTPECRTQLSPTQNWSCQLRRRGATFHRVGQAVVEATERRIQQWNQGVVDDLPADHTLLAASVSAPTSTKIDEMVGNHAAGKVRNEQTQQIAAMDVASQPLSPTLAVSAVRPASRRSSECRPLPVLVIEESDDDRGHHGSFSLSAFPSLTKASRSQSLCDLSLPKGIVQPNHNSPLCSSDCSTSSEPSLDFSSDSKPSSESLPTPGLTSAFENICEPSDHSGPTTDQNFEQIRVSSDVEGPAVSPRSHDRRKVKEKSWSWLPVHTPKMTSVRRMKSVSRRARREANRRNKLATAKAKIIGDSMVDLSNRIFHRVEAQEMIDTTRLGEELSLEGSRRSSSSHDDAETGRDSPSAHPKRSKGHDPQASSHPQPSHSESVLSTQTSQDIPSRPQHGRSSSSGLLPPIPEVSPIHDSHGQALFTPRRSSELIISPIKPDSEMTNQAQRKISSPSEPTRHTRSISLGSSPQFNRVLGGRPSEDTKRGVQSDDVDWTAFQMAISGPTGDYLMGGEASSDNGGTDEIVDWFLDFGFESEGLLVQTEETEEPAYVFDPDDAGDDYSDYDDEDEDEDDPLSGITSIAAAVEGQLRMIEEEQRIRDERREQSRDHGWTMSSNLTDLGDYLSFENYHGGPFASFLPPSWS